jgi:hypothetical protein
LSPIKGLPGPVGDQLRLDLEHAQQRLAFVGFGAGQGEGDRQAVQGAHQVQAQAPEEPRVAGAVPVLRPSGQVGPLGRLAGASALDRGGVDHPHVICPQRGVDRQQPCDIPDQVRSLAQPLVVSRLSRQVGKQVPQVGAGVAEPLPFGGEAEHRLQHRERDQFGIAELGRDAHLRPVRGQLRRILEQVIALDEQRGREGVQIGVHRASRLRRRAVRRRSLEGR